MELGIASPPFVEAGKFTTSIFYFIIRTGSNIVAPDQAQIIGVGWITFVIKIEPTVRGIFGHDQTINVVGVLWLDEIIKFAKV